MITELQHGRKIANRIRQSKECVFPMDWRAHKMTVGDLRKMNLPDDTEIEINSVWNKDKQELTPASCYGFYHKKDKKIYLTPDVISI